MQCSSLANQWYDYYDRIGGEGTGGAHPRVSILYTAFFLHIHASDTRTRERKEYSVFRELMKMVPNLEDRLMSSSEEGVMAIAELVSTRVLEFVVV